MTDNEKLQKEIQEEEKKLDLRDLKNMIKSIFIPKDKEKTSQKDSDLEFDSKKIVSFCKEHKTVLITIFLLLIVIFSATYFRVMPSYLPITQNWAEDSVYDYYQQQITQQVNQQYPNLPEQNKRLLIENELNKILDQQKEIIDQQIDTTAEQFKAELQDDSGQTYLLAIDPYLWYGYSKNYVEHGHWGNEKIEGSSWYTLRNGRQGLETRFNTLSFLTIVQYKILNFFGDSSIFSSAFFLPVILLTIAAIGAFFVGKSLGGNLTGLIAGTIVGIHAALLSRTAAGFTDTDNLITVFEILVILFFFFAIRTTNRKNLVFATLSGLMVGLYANSHQSWWHIFDFLIGGMIFYMIFLFIKDYLSKKKININSIKDPLLTTLVFVVSSWLFGAFVRLITVGTFFDKLKSMITVPLTAPFSFIGAKEVAVNSIWPNVLTTVAELNSSSLKAVISQIGGGILFILSIIGIIYLFYKGFRKNPKYIFYSSFLALWFLGAIYAAQSSIRFIAFLVPPFAIALGVSVNLFTKQGATFFEKSLKVNRLIGKTIIGLVLILIIFVPLVGTAYATAQSQIPSMNDAWYDSLTKIKENSNDAIITSWWDFGHWFVAIAERRVTFDGGDQGERIHWVGKSLLTPDEKIAVGTLRMLNCGQEQAPHVLDRYFEGDTVKAINVLNSFLQFSNKESARDFLKKEGLDENQIESFLALSYCEDLIPNFLITSEDMVGKAGVWGHFGAWDFERATMYQQTKKLSQAKGVEYLTKTFSLSEQEARQVYTEIQSTSADQWISPWPGYFGGGSCTPLNKEELSCIIPQQNGQIQVNINLLSKEASIPTNEGTVSPLSLVYANNNKIEEITFQGERTTDFSLILLKDNTLLVSDPLQAKSMFTQLFFFDGLGLECFEKFDDRTAFNGQKIITWKINFSC